MIGVFGDSWAGNRRDDAQITTVETNIRQRSGHRATQPLREVGNDAWRDHQPELTRLIHTGGCNSFTRQSLLSAETDPFRLDSQFECSRTYSHQYQDPILNNVLWTVHDRRSSLVGINRGVRNP
jgi:hypothetical protein